MNREERVAVFNRIMGQPIGEDPKKVPLHLRQLAIKLIFEELQELAEASGCSGTFAELSSKAAVASEDSDDINEVMQLDGLCDVQYTLSWAVNVLGFRENFEAAYDETCISNDSKSCINMEDAEATRIHWENKDGAGHYIDTVVFEGNTYYVVKNSIGKVKKSIKYKPANFAQFIKN